MIQKIIISLKAYDNYLSSNEIKGDVTEIRINSMMLTAISPAEVDRIKKHSIAKNLAAIPTAWSSKGDKIFLWPASKKDVDVEIF